MTLKDGLPGNQRELAIAFNDGEPAADQRDGTSVGAANGVTVTHGDVWLPVDALSRKLRSNPIELAPLQSGKEAGRYWMLPSSRDAFARIGVAPFRAVSTRRT